jgi:hypothetical protein
MTTHPRCRALRLLATLMSALIATALTVLPARAAAAPLAALHVSGNQIVDTTGSAVRLLGVNRDGTEYACSQGWGIFDGPSDQASVAAIAAWHTNAVRVTVNEQCWLGINGVKPALGGASYQKALTDYVGLLNANGLYAVLDLQMSGPGASLATAGQEMPDADHTPAFWNSVATALKSSTGVIYNVFNEPHRSASNPTQADWDCWRDGCAMTTMQTSSGPVAYSWQTAGMQTLVDSIRRTGATQPILLDGMAWAADLSRWIAEKPNDPANNLVAGYHIYNFSCADATCAQAHVYPNADTVPVLIGEIGQNDCSHAFIDQLMPWADSHRLGYLGWAWDAWPGGCGPGPTLISDYTGTPTPYGVGLRDHLAALAGGTGVSPITSVQDWPFTTGNTALRSGTLGINATGAGDLLVITIGTAQNGAAPTVASVGDNKGERWSLAVASGSGLYRGEVWYVPNAVAGVTSVTITLSAAGYWQGHIQEVSGISATHTVLDGARGGASSTSTVVSSGSVQTRSAREFLTGTIIWDSTGGTLTLTSTGWSPDAAQAYVPAEFHAVRTGAPAGPSSLDGTMSVPASWVSLVAAFTSG